MNHPLNEWVSDPVDGTGHGEAVVESISPAPSLGSGSGCGLDLPRRVPKGSISSSRTGGLAPDSDMQRGGRVDPDCKVEGSKCFIAGVCLLEWLESGPRLLSTLV